MLVHLCDEGHMPRVVIIGLDSLSPDLLFERYLADLPSFRRLAAQGIATPLESSVPPITVPAWACMTTGVDPGTLGVYGFHHRQHRGYEPGALASSMSHNVPTLWQLVGDAGRRSRILGVPLTYPPKPMRGALVTGCLTPSTEVDFTYPPELAAEVQEISGGYIIDVANFRELAPEVLLQTIHLMTERRFRLARSWLVREDWDLFMMVEMGSDRMHHGFLLGEDVPHDEAGSSGAPRDLVRDYYRMLDDELAQLLALVSDDDVVLVVSDHGTQPLRGALAINDVLIEAGYLVLSETHARTGPLDIDAVDWEHSRAWGEGGYVGRIHLNVRGREPCGCVRERDVPGLLQEIERLFVHLPGPAGESLRTAVLRPDVVYGEVRGVAPDLMVYVDDLRYRAVGSVGHGGPWTHNDRGRDCANHSRHGVLMLRDAGGHRSLASVPTLYDIAPTVLDRLGITIPTWMKGRVIR